MEFLKKSLLFLCVFFLNAFVFAQDESKIIKAFEESYSLETKGEYAKSIEKIKSVFDSESYEMNLRLGWLHYKLGRFTESMTYYQKAMDLMPYSEEAKFGMINPATALGKWEQVINLYNKILEISPKNTSANYYLGTIYYGKKEYQKSYDYFKVVVDLYPFSYDGLLMFAWSNLQLGKMREAKVLFNKVLMISPNDSSATEGLKYIK